MINNFLAVKKTLLFLFFLAAIAGLTGCASKNIYEYRFNTVTEQNNIVPYPDVFFAVISDTHVFDPSLGSDALLFRIVLNTGSKMFLDSIALLDFAIDEIIASNAGFVLICGDLTKEGELINHLILAERLNRLKEAGISAYVVPGNHDVNARAKRYSGLGYVRVPNVNAEKFAQIYGDFGYNCALFRDNYSLSYVVQPVEGLWLLALDTCKGSLKQETINWIYKMLYKAQAEGKAVMAMMHHGVVEQWLGQGERSPRALINDYINFGHFLASWNVRLVFTGHSHAQNITRADFENGFLYNIQTGSLVTPPCPVRYIEIKDNVVNIRSDALVDKIYPDTDFADNARNFLRRSAEFNAAIDLIGKCSIRDIRLISQAAAEATIAHRNGDEDPALRTHLDESMLGLGGRLVLRRRQEMFDSLWTDLPPADNNVIINLP
jgi:hypothetical protein